MVVVFCVVHNVQSMRALKYTNFLSSLKWQNHADSLKREEETKRKINQKIQEKVNNNIGTWIDWQYLLDAAQLLAKVSSCWFDTAAFFSLYRGKATRGTLCPERNVIRRMLSF